MYEFPVSRIIFNKSIMTKISCNRFEKIMLFLDKTFKSCSKLISQYLDVLSMTFAWQLNATLRKGHVWRNMYDKAHYTSHHYYCCENMIKISRVLFETHIYHLREFAICIALPAKHFMDGATAITITSRIRKCYPQPLASECREILFIWFPYLILIELKSWYLWNELIIV